MRIVALWLFAPATYAARPELACPTLVSVAEDDILVPPRFSRALAAAIPGAALQTVERAGHCYFWERPDTFNTTSLAFLARHTAS